MSPSPSVSILFSFLPKARVQTEAALTALTSQNIKKKGHMNCVLDVFIYPDLNMKLTLNSFLDKTSNSKLKREMAMGRE